MIINEEAMSKKVKNNILTLGKEASDEKKKDPKVINSTSGMFCDEEGNLYEFSSVKKAINELDTRGKYAYSDTAGSFEFSKAIEEWVFGDSLNQVLEQHQLAVIPTPGGSGAITLLMANYMRAGETILLPNHMWEIYLVYAKEFGCKSDTYNLFNNQGEFDFDTLRLKIDLLKKTQKRITIIFNDPCENPTGFCMKDKDYDTLIDIANQNPLTEFVFLMDMAYFDFYNENANIIRSRYAKLRNMPDNVLVMFAFSGSKSFGLYGLRIGALMAMSRNSDEIKYFVDASCFSARARWSSATTLGMNIISTLILNKEYKRKFREEVAYVCKLLTKRKDAFLKSCDEVNLETLPYQNGFFICIPCKNPDRMMHALHQDKAYVIATKSCLRIALCAINEQEAKVLPKIIKGRMILEED